MHPIDIQPVGGTEVLITWDDGHRSLYPYTYLRLNCPCASCTEEWSGRKLITLDKVPPDIHPLATTPVGRYALRFDWSDGHRTGIYSFDFLRKICPCGQCRSASKSHAYPESA